MERHALNSFLKEAGFATSGDLVLMEPARSETKEVRPSERSVVVTISTRGRDRHGDVLDPAGCRLERFRKNPVVLYAHDYDGLPVARSLWERVRENELIAKPQFHLDTQLSREVWALIEKGVLSAWSVGFIPEQWEPVAPASAPAGSEARLIGRAGFRVRKWDLLEYSCVPVPANFEALTHALEERRITAPALVKSLTPLGMRAPDLVAPNVAAVRAAGPAAVSPESRDGSPPGGVAESDAGAGARLLQGRAAAPRAAAPDGSSGAAAEKKSDRLLLARIPRAKPDELARAVSRGFGRALARARGETP